jgi:hypothetical protein
MTPTQFAERRVLPLVCAFAAGVLIALEASAIDERKANRTAVRAIAVAQHYAQTCDLAWPPIDAADLPELVANWRTAP